MVRGELAAECCARSASISVATTDSQAHRLIGMSTMRSKIMEYVSSELLIDPERRLSEDEELLATGRIDSMSVMRLVGFINEEFMITIPNEDLVIENFQSVDAIDTYLSRYDSD